MVEDEIGVHVWVLLGLPLALLLIGASLRIVPGGRRLVVTRGGVVRRVAEHRLVARWPVLEQIAAEPSSDQVLALTVRAFTRDGSDVRVLAELVLRVGPPRRGEQVREGWSPTARVTEALLAEAIGATAIADLPGALTCRLPELAERAGTVEQATRVLDLRVEGLEVLLVDAGADARIDRRGSS